MAELMVRMAELAVSPRPEDVLVSLGLGSCIGVALLADGRIAAALAHVVLPSSAEGTAVAGSEAKYADTAVPLLVTRVAALGVPRSRLWAVMVGGAKMFALGRGSMDVGARNTRAVQEALRAAGIPIRAAVTGGGVGRTIRVYTGQGRVTCKESGGPELDLLKPPGRMPEARAA